MCLTSTFTAAAVALVLLAAPALAQVMTDCNPMQHDDCPRDPAFGTKHTFDMAMEPSEALWEQTVRGVEFDGENGAKFMIKEQGNSPTLRTKFYFFWGRTELHIKCAPGQGIISSMMWLSDNLDEVDFEMFGTKDQMVATNYFGKGVQDWHNGADFNISGNIHGDYHNYTTVWTADKLEWWVDNNLFRTLLRNDATGGKYFPQTPMRLSVGIWAGGDPHLPEGTRQWAGGDTDYSNAPFTMWVKDVTIEDYTKGAREYYFSDRSGSSSSIKVEAGTSDALDAIQNNRLTSADDNVQQDVGPTLGESAASSWKNLSAASKTAIFASIGGAVALFGVIGGFFCVRQRRRGRAAAIVAEEQWKADRVEEERMRARGVNPDSFAEHNTEYDLRTMGGEKTLKESDSTASLRRNNSWELQPQQAWDPTSGDGVGSGVLLGNVPETPRSPPRTAAASVDYPDSHGGFESRSDSPGPVPRSYTGPRHQFDDYSYGRL